MIIVDRNIPSVESNIIETGKLVIGPHCSYTKSMYASHIQHWYFLQFSLLKLLSVIHNPLELFSKPSASIVASIISVPSYP